MDTLFIKPAATTAEAWILQLEDWMAAAQADAAAGKTITQAGAADTYNTKQMTASPATRIAQLREALAYYAPASYSMPCRRTTVAFQ